MNRYDDFKNGLSEGYNASAVTIFGMLAGICTIRFGKEIAAAISSISDNTVSVGSDKIVLSGLAIIGGSAVAGWLRYEFMGPKNFRNLPYALGHVSGLFGAASVPATPIIWFNLPADLKASDRIPGVQIERSGNRVIAHMPRPA